MEPHPDRVRVLPDLRREEAVLVLEPGAAVPDPEVDPDLLRQRNLRQVRSPRLTEQSTRRKRGSVTRVVLEQS